MLKTTILCLALLLLLAACNGGEQAAGPETGLPAGPFPFEFTTTDLGGNQVSDATLEERELFFVYFWTTWCPACVNSMPGLAQLANEFDDRVGFISLLGDYATARDTAVRITRDAEVPFITVDAHLPQLSELLQLVQSGFLPTSVIIDANGDVVGSQIVGGGTDRIRTAIEDALSR